MQFHYHRCQKQLKTGRFDLPPLHHHHRRPSCYQQYFQRRFRRCFLEMGLLLEYYRYHLLVFENLLKKHFHHQNRQPYQQLHCQHNRRRHRHLK